MSVGGVKVSLSVSGQYDASANAALKAAVADIKNLGGEVGNVKVQMNSFTDSMAAARQLRQMGVQAGRVTVAMGNLGEETKKAGDGFLGLGHGVQAAIAKMTAATMVIGKVVSGLQKLWEMTEEGSRAADRFDVLDASVDGFRQKVMLAKEATKGMVPEAEITKTLALFESFRIPMDNFQEVMEQVTRTAIRTGESTEFLMQSIVKGLGREETRILDNLGIIVRVGETTEAYAKSLGKLPSQLTEVERKTALLNATMKALRRSNENVNLELTRTGPIERWNAKITDAKNSVGEFIGDINLGWSKAVDLMNGGFERWEASVGAVAETLPAHLRAIARSVRVNAEEIVDIYENALLRLRTFGSQIRTMARDDRELAALEEAQDIAERKAVVRKEFELAQELQRYYRELAKSQQATDAGTQFAEGLLGIGGQQAERIKKIREEHLKNNEAIRERNRLQTMSDVAEAATKRKLELQEELKVQTELKNNTLNLRELEKQLDAELAGVGKPERLKQLEGLTETIRTNLRTAREDFERAKGHDDWKEMSAIQERIVSMKEERNLYEKMIALERERAAAAKKQQPAVDLPSRPQALIEPLHRTGSDIDKLVAKMDDARRQMEMDLEVINFELAGLDDLLSKGGLDKRNRKRIEEATEKALDDRERALHQYAERKVRIEESIIAKTQQLQRRAMDEYERGQERKRRADEKAHKKQLDMAASGIDLAGQATDAWVKGEQERAAIMATLAIADGIVGYLRYGDPTMIAQGVLAAAIYASEAAGASGAQGGSGVTPTAAPRGREFNVGGGTTVMNLYLTGALVGTMQELGAVVNGAQDRAGGMRAGAV